MPRDNQGENRIASFRNAPERAGHCLTRMLPMRGHFVNRKPSHFNSQRLGNEWLAGRDRRRFGAALASTPRPRKACFPVRSVSLLSRPDLAPPKLRRAT